MSSLSGIGLLTSFGAGVISFLSPCVLPLVPGYVSYVAGRRPEGRASQTARGTRPQSFLRVRLLDRVRDPGGERDDHRSTMVRRKIWSAADDPSPRTSSESRSPSVGRPVSCRCSVRS